MRKRAVYLEGVVDRLRLRVLAVELGGLPTFLRPAGRADDPLAGPERPRPERVPGPAAAVARCGATRRAAGWRRW